MDAPITAEFAQRYEAAARVDLGRVLGAGRGGLAHAIVKAVEEHQGDRPSDDVLVVE
jgi:hypothetical protein